ncbi:hypothetical protein TD95_001283, partial [Thielaviopsis punctulata]
MAFPHSQWVEETNSPGENPPPYSVTNIVPPDKATSFSNPPNPSAQAIPLKLTNEPGPPTEDRCIAHLRFLHAIMELREEIGYTDGLWGIYDTPPDKSSTATDGATSQAPNPAAGSKLLEDDIEKHKATLSKLREKRWAIYVARAVERYAAWWEAFPKNILTRDKMQGSAGNSPDYGLFAHQTDKLEWKAEHMPPLDVLMVWHTHMLNPRDYLEDCLRVGHRGLWLAGFPWALVSAAINTDFTYSASPAAMEHFQTTTKHEWDNVDDSPYQKIRCPIPGCNKQIYIAWTTCTNGLSKRLEDFETLTEAGYGDNGLHVFCGSCHTAITREMLCVSKFMDDASNLAIHNRPMPGSILHLMTGTPEWEHHADVASTARDFPNIATLAIFDKDTDALLCSPSPVTMQNVKQLFDTNFKSRSVQQKLKQKQITGKWYRLRAKHFRKMMSRYYDNNSPFALNLVGALMRQGVFAGKMQSMDWLHSPTVRPTMGRLIQKYHRFMSLMDEVPDFLLVPTLDIDLAWHTAQLSPSYYYHSTVGPHKRLLDHDDKVDETKLSDSFQKTSRLYQERFKEVYSECTCWYCEATRADAVSTVASKLSLSKQERVAEKWWSSGAATECPHDKSAHISSHSAVCLTPKKDHIYRIYDSRLEKQYLKAQRRAAKQGRKLPPRGTYYDHWGTSYYMYAPYAFPIYYHPGLYPCSDVNTANTSDASCVTGTCGGGIAAGQQVLVEVAGEAVVVEAAVAVEAEEVVEAEEEAVEE